MIDLTDKWKKGELLEGFYYVKCDWSDEVEIRYVHNGVDDWKEIVAEVPSYDEWQEKLEENTQLKTENKWFSEELHAWVDRAGDLEDLLKECRLAIFDYPPYDLASDKIRLQIKINQALGEDK